MLAAIIATVFFQSYSDIKRDEKERAEKIKEVGHYALAFRKRESDQGEESGRFVVLISDDSDFNTQASEYPNYKVVFLTSKDGVSCLKNIMAFEQEYFVNNKRDIIGRYLEYCQQVEYVSPIFTRALPYRADIIEDKECDISLVVKRREAGMLCFWITAITESGVLYLNRVKIELKKLPRDRYHCTLIQQTNYYVQNGRVTALVQD